MTTAYSTNLELALPVQGELSGTWGDTVNNGITQYLDTAIAGSQIISGSQTAVTLTNTNGDASATNIAQAGSGATGTAQYQIIRCTGNPAGLLTITISDTLTAGYSKTFVIINSTSTSQSVKIVGSGPTTGVTVASGAKALVAWNGSDFVEVASSTADGVTTFSAGTTGLTPSTATTGAVTLAGTLGTANGGTNLGGATPFTANGVVYASSSSALATGSAMTFSGSQLAVTGTATFKSIYSTTPSQFTTFNYDGVEVQGAQDAYYIAPSGRAQIWYLGGSEGMRLTSTGLGIGTSSPSSKLSVLSSSQNVASFFHSSTSTSANNGGAAIKIQNTSNTNGNMQSVFFADSSGTVSSAIVGYNANQTTNEGFLTFGTRNSSGTFGEGMRIDSSGNVLIGTTANANSARLKSKVSGGSVGFEVTDEASSDFVVVPASSAGICKIGPTAGGMSFQSAGSERMRIANDGKVGIGVTDVRAVLQIGSGNGGGNVPLTSKLMFGANNSIVTFLSANDGASVDGAISSYNTVYAFENAKIVFDKPAGNLGQLLFYTNEGSGITERARLPNNGGFSVGTTASPGSGGIFATGNITAYYSDARLKTVSGKIENALDKVAQLSGVYYTNNSVAKSFGYDSDEVQVGVLAQDVEAVLPEIVKAAPFDLDENGNSKSGENYKTVQYERLVPLLIEAINELRAEVKALKGA